MYVLDGVEPGPVGFRSVGGENLVVVRGELDRGRPPDSDVAPVMNTDFFIA
jgi:hypothetical protein